MHHLGRVEELLAAVDHLPLALEPDVDHQRHQRVQDLRHAAAERGGRHVQDPLALAAARRARGSRRRAGGRRCSRSRRGACGGRRPAGAWRARDRRGETDGRTIPTPPPSDPHIDSRSASDPGVDRAHELRVQRGVRGRDRGHLELVAGPEQRVAIQRLAPAVGDDAARLGQAQPRRGQVIGRVVEHLPAAHALELRAHPGDLVDQARPDLDHRVELAGHDPRHRERLRPELERAAAHRRGVDQVAQHLGHARAGRPRNP